MIVGNATNMSRVAYSRRHISGTATNSMLEAGSIGKTRAGITHPCLEVTCSTHASHFDVNSLGKCASKTAQLVPEWPRLCGHTLKNIF